MTSDLQQARIFTNVSCAKLCKYYNPNICTITEVRLHENAQYSLPNKPEIPNVISQLYFNYDRKLFNIRALKNHNFLLFVNEVIEKPVEDFLSRQGLSFKKTRRGHEFVFDVPA